MSEFHFAPQHAEALKDFRLDGVHNDQEVLAVLAFQSGDTESYK